MAAWDEGTKIVQRAKLFSGGAFVILLLLSIYSAAVGNVFDAAYFGVFSAVSLLLFFYVRKTFKTGGSQPSKRS